jgi:hypothetical protein
MLRRGHPPRVRHPRPLPSSPVSLPISFWGIANDLVMANDLDDLDQAEGSPAAGGGPRAGHRRPRTPNHDVAVMAVDRAAALVGEAMPTIYA